MGAGPLDLLRDAWESPTATATNVFTYVFAMKKKMEEMASLVKDNLQHVQETQTSWYAKSARQ